MMDFRLWKYVKTRKQQIIDLKEELARVKGKLELRDEKIETLEAKIRGFRVCDSYCALCKNSYVNANNPYIGVTSYDCILNCHCEGFEFKEEIEDE